MSSREVRIVFPRLNYFVKQDKPKLHGDYSADSTGFFTQQSKYRHIMLHALLIECHLMSPTLIQSLCGMDIHSFLFHVFRALMLKGVTRNCLLVSPWWTELQYKQHYSTHRLK